MLAVTPPSAPSKLNRPYSAEHVLGQARLARLGDVRHQHERRNGAAVEQRRVDARHVCRAREAELRAAVQCRDVGHREVGRGGRERDVRVDDPARLELIALGVRRVVGDRVLRVVVEAGLAEVVRGQIELVVEQAGLEAVLVERRVRDACCRWRRPARRPGRPGR